MDVRDKVRLLIRVAQKCPDDSNALLAWAEELLGGGAREDGSLARSADVSQGPRIPLPLPIFRVYKGRRYDALLLDGWRVELNGTTHPSPSAAANAVSHHSENGLITWRYLDSPSGRVLAIRTLRHA